MPDDAKDPVLFEGTHLRLAQRAGWEFAERRRASSVVLIVATTPERKLVLTEQYRIPVRSRVIELPAGLVGDVPGHENESIERAARRELLEETGYEVDSMRPIWEGPVSAGMSSEVVIFMHAEGLRKVGPGGGDANEDIEVHEVSLEDVPRWLREQSRREKMVDPKILAGLFLTDGTSR